MNRRRTTHKANLILASESPRRNDLLRQAGLTFTVVPSSVDERPISGASPEEHVRRLAEAKASQIAEDYPEDWVIGADTIVVLGKDVLGKPRTKAQARHMLQALSGKKHRVLTGYCICCRDVRHRFSEVVETSVFFKRLSKREIEWYIGTKEPFDKAGAYGAQGVGCFLIKRLEGSYTNVVGLPVCEVVDYLVRKGIIER